MLTERLKGAAVSCPGCGRLLRPGRRVVRGEGGAYCVQCAGERGMLPEGSRPLRGTVEVAAWCAREGLPAVVRGRWVWVEFDEQPPAELRERLAVVGFRWIRARGAWAHNCGFPSRRGNPYKYGAVPVSAFDASDAEAVAV